MLGMMRMQERGSARPPWRGLGGGVAATAVITPMALASQSLGLMRLDFGRMLGTVLRPDGRGTRRLGWGLHFLNGALFGLGYRELFRRTTGLRPGAITGGLLGVGHFAAAMGALALVPYLHPRPRQAGLEPLRPTAYGPMTVPGMLVSHIIYGAVMGALLARGAPAPSSAGTPSLPFPARGRTE